MKLVNIRESLLEIDRATDCQYDLTSLYESCKLEDEDKKQLVQYIEAHEEPAEMGKFLATKCEGLTEKLGDDDVVDIDKFLSELNDGESHSIYALEDKADKLNEDTNWRTNPSNRKEVQKYVYSKIKPFDELTDDNSRYWDFDRAIDEGDEAVLVKAAPRGAKYLFSLLADGVDIDIYLGRADVDTWYVVDNNPEIAESAAAGVAMALGTAAATGFGQGLGDKVGAKLMGEDADDDDEPEYVSDFSDGEVEPGMTFFADGYDWKWIRRIGDVVHLDFDNWAVWMAFRPEDENNPSGPNVVQFFIVDEDTGFIDWGPVDTMKEAQEFLQSKVDDWEDDDYDIDESMKDSLTVCPACGGENFNDNTGLCIDCGYDENSWGDTSTDDVDESVKESLSSRYIDKDGYVSISNIANYIVDTFDGDIDDRYACINSLIDSFKDEGKVSIEVIHQFAGGHNLVDKKIDESTTELVEDSEETDDLISAEQEFDSAATSINSSKLPAVYNMVKFNPGDVVVDFGGGKFDNAVNYLKDQDVTLLVYDPYNRSAEHNKDVLRVLKEHDGADAAVNSNVLNVIKEPEARNAVLQNIKKITKKGAPIYITVYEGTGKGNEGPTKSGYQLNRKTSDYIDEISQVFSNVTRKGKLITAINESLTEEANPADLKTKLETAAREFIINNLGYDDDFVNDYIFVDVKKDQFADGDEAIKCEIRTELDYEECEQLANALNPIVAAEDKNAYFDMETSNVIVSYLRTDFSDDVVDEAAVAEFAPVIEAITTMERLREVYRDIRETLADVWTTATFDAVHDLIMAKADELNGVNEAVATMERPAKKDLTSIDGTIASVLNAHKEEIDACGMNMNAIKSCVTKILTSGEVKGDAAAQKAVMIINNCRNLSQLLSTLTGYMTGMNAITNRRTSSRKRDVSASLTTEAVEDDNEDKPYTYRQVFDELKLETKNFTVESDSGRYGYESEAQHAVKILEKHYASVEIDKVGSWFQVEFKGLKKGRKVNESYRGDELTELLDWLLTYNDGKLWDPFVVEFEEIEDDMLDPEDILSWLQSYDEAAYDDLMSSELYESKSIKESESVTSEFDNLITPIKDKYPEVDFIINAYKKLGCEVVADSNKERDIVESEIIKITAGTKFKYAQSADRLNKSRGHRAYVNMIFDFDDTSLNESKSIKESAISRVEPVVKFRGKSSHTFTPDKKWEIDFDEEGNVLARTRHGKPYYFSGHINDKTNEFGHTDEDAIIQAAREQHKLKFGKLTSRKNESKSIKESFPRNIDLDQVVIQVANLVDDKALGDEWIEVFPTRDASQSVGGEYFVPLEITGPDDVTKKATFRTRNGRVEVAFLNGSEAMCDSAESIARFIAGEFGLGLGGETPLLNDIPNEQLKEGVATYLYLFPELTDEDLQMAKAYGLQYLGKNHGADGSEDNWVVAGSENSLTKFAERWLGYELHPDYLYDADDFAGDIDQD